MIVNMHNNVSKFTAVARKTRDGRRTWVIISTPIKFNKRFEVVASSSPLPKNIQTVYDLQHVWQEFVEGNPGTCKKIQQVEVEFYNVETADSRVNKNNALSVLTELRGQLLKDFSNYLSNPKKNQSQQWKPVNQVQENAQPQGLEAVRTRFLNAMKNKTPNRPKPKNLPPLRPHKIENYDKHAGYTYDLKRALYGEERG
jgi:hypothetical protein